MITVMNQQESDYEPAEILATSGTHQGRLWFDYRGLLHLGVGGSHLAQKRRQYTDVTVALTAHCRILGDRGATTCAGSIRVHTTLGRRWDSIHRTQNPHHTGIGDFLGINLIGTLERQREYKFNIASRTLDSFTHKA